MRSYASRTSRNVSATRRSSAARGAAGTAASRAANVCANLSGCHRSAAARKARLSARREEEALESSGELYTSKREGCKSASKLFEELFEELSLLRASESARPSPSFEKRSAAPKAGPPPSSGTAPRARTRLRRGKTRTSAPRAFATARGARRRAPPRIRRRERHREPQHLRPQRACAPSRARASPPRQPRASSARASPPPGACAARRRAFF